MNIPCLLFQQATVGVRYLVSTVSVFVASKNKSLITPLYLPMLGIYKL